VWLDKCHEITHADVLKASPPPDWTAEDEQAHAAIWRRRHVSNPSTEQRVAAHLARSKREASELPSAEEWREEFGC
jgi:hypothetical protein